MKSPPACKDHSGGGWRAHLWQIGLLSGAVGPVFQIHHQQELFPKYIFFKIKRKSCVLCNSLKPCVPQHLVPFLMLPSAETFYSTEYRCKFLTTILCSTEMTPSKVLKIQPIESLLVQVSAAAASDVEQSLSRYWEHRPDVSNSIMSGRE